MNTRDATRINALPPATATAQAQCAFWLERVATLAPALDAAGEEIERTRRVPAPLMAALHEAQLFRLLLPRSRGGAEAHPLAFMHVLEAVAARNASVAWNLGQNSVCAIVAAYLEPATADRVFGPPDSILAWGPATGPARATACEGGYRVSGRWSFASGMRHATWLGAQCPVFEADGTPRLDAKGDALKRTLLMPAGAAIVHDIWDVLGLRGTASDAYEVKDLFVAEAYSVDRESNAENREPGWLYRLNTFHLFAAGFGAVALGVARAMLDALLELAQDKRPRGMGPLRENAAFQSDLARAEARWRAARALHFGTVGDLCAALQQAPALTLAQRMDLRLAATQAIREAKAAGGFAFEAAGATAIFSANPFERRFRDLHAIGQQVQGRASHYETVGRFLLGDEGGGAFT
ncbi:MAG TPA: acyl-CoA dehydrogenase family protein [Burkholderiales bacterium]